MIVFAGPSLAGRQNLAQHGFDLRGPVRQGDVYLAALERPAAIGIIDGYFEDVPSVWHKEILWAISQGIVVLGAASMGALRAAELDAFGMTGIGAIYAAYRDGVLEDDDEVALVHGPEELGYPAMSVAMVNVRATCKAAVDCSLLSPAQADGLIHRAKAQFYKGRTWDSVLQDAGRDLLPEGLVREFRGWLGENEVDQKRDDALLLLDRMARGDYAPPAADYHFEQTALWVRTTAQWRQLQRRESVEETGVYRLLGNFGND